MCQLADMLYFEHRYKFRTILYSLELKNYTKLWVHGNWGRTETGDTTVLYILPLWPMFMNENGGRYIAVTPSIRADIALTTYYKVHS